MRDYTMLNASYYLGDHFAQVSKDAKLLYIEMSFYSDYGFVANPLQIIRNGGYETDSLTELIRNGDVLQLPGRSEVFLASFYVHNPGLTSKRWLKSPFSTYWRGKLWLKDNGVATFKPQLTQEDVANLPYRFVKPDRAEVDVGGEIAAQLDDDSKLF